MDIKLRSSTGRGGGGVKKVQEGDRGKGQRESNLLKVEERKRYGEIRLETTEKT